MVEVIFTHSVAGNKDGIRYAFGKGKVVTMDKEDADKWVNSGRAKFYDDHVSEVKDKARSTLKPLKKPKRKPRIKG